MALFSFSITESTKPSLAPTVLELPTSDEARIEAIRVLVGLAADALPDGNTHDFAVVVGNEEDVRIFEATLAMARWSLATNARVVPKVQVPGIKLGYRSKALSVEDRYPTLLKLD